MSTNDVPGANPANRDELAMGCWAEHADGSLIFVENTEGDRVVYSMFDTALEPALEFRDAMSEVDFKRTYSWPNQDNERWTWHDKTAFPWDRVMRDFPAGTRVASAGAMSTAAARIAERLGRRRSAVDPNDVGHLRYQVREASGIIGRIQAALDRLRP